MENGKIFDFTDVDESPIRLKLRGIELEFRTATLKDLSAYQKKLANNQDLNLEDICGLLAAAFTKETKKMLAAKYPNERERNYSAILTSLIPVKKVNVLTEIIKEIYGDLAGESKKKEIL